MSDRVRDPVICQFIKVCTDYPASCLTCMRNLARRSVYESP